MKMRWSELVREQMKNQSITREKIGTALGKTPGAIGHWLNGRREPSLSEIAAIFNFLAINSVTLYCDGLVSIEPSQVTNKKVEKNLTPEQESILMMLDSLPDEEVKRFKAELKAKKAHYDAIFEEMLKKRQGTTS